MVWLPFDMPNLPISPRKFIDGRLSLCHSCAPSRSCVLTCCRKRARSPAAHHDCRSIQYRLRDLLRRLCFHGTAELVQNYFYTILDNLAPGILLRSRTVARLHQLEVCP